MMDSPDSRSEAEMPSPEMERFATEAARPGAKMGRRAVCPTCESDDPKGCDLKHDVRSTPPGADLGRHSVGLFSNCCHDPFHSPSDKGVEERRWVLSASRDRINERGAVAIGSPIGDDERIEVVPATASDQRIRKLEGLLRSGQQVIDNALSAVENLGGADGPESYLTDDWQPFARSYLSTLRGSSE